MKEYYVLLLNNCHDKGIHWVCENTFSLLPNILEKDIQDLSLLENEFMDLDNVVISNENSYHVFGSFPVFGEILEDGKMHDVITGKIITKAENSKEANGLSYNAAYKADCKMTEELLTLIGEEEKKRYTAYLENLEIYSKRVFHGAIEAEKYYTFRLANMSIHAIPVIAKKINGNLIDVITKEKISLCPIANTISSNLNARISDITQYEISTEDAIKYQLAIIELGVEDYIRHVNDTKTNSIRNYNNYISLNKDYLKIKHR